MHYISLSSLLNYTTSNCTLECEECPIIYVFCIELKRTGMLPEVENLKPKF